MFRFTGINDKPLIIPVFIPHLGCPNMCAFCDQRLISGIEEPSLENIEKSVKDYLGWSKKREKTEISFYGGSFTAIPFEKMMQYIKKGVEFIDNGSVNVLRCSTRPDAIDIGIAKILKENHFETVELGVQSLSNNLLKKMNRGHTVDDVFNAVRILRKEGLKTVVQLMAGYPYESESDFNITLLKLKKLKPDALRIYPFVPIENTEIYSQIKEGIVKKVLPDHVIDRTAKIFIASMSESIPVIRIGLHMTSGIPDIYPHNLYQIVICRAVEKLAADGETEFEMPENMITGFNMAKKKYPQIKLSQS
ncbi:MAG TPA: radical SAM protein [bacterium]|nr:radical SAM protein [bacterium]HPS29420.1 radical SAM protein [bacterium]